MLSSLNLFGALNQSKLGNHKDIKKWFAKNLENNIQNCHSENTEVKLSGRVEYLDRYDDLLVVVTQDQNVVLINLVARFDRWTMKLPDLTLEYYQYVKIQLSSTGMVACIAQKGKDPWVAKKHASEIKILTGGKMIGSIISDVPLFQNSIRIIKDRIFAVSQDHKNFYEWNEDGKLVRTITFSENHQDIFADHFLTKITEDYYLITSDKLNCSNTIPIFIFYLNNNESRLSHVNINQYHRLSDATIDNHQLFLGLYDPRPQERENRQLYNISSNESKMDDDNGETLDSKITIFDLISTKFRNEYNIKDMKKSIFRLAVQNNFIAILVSETHGNSEVFLFNTETKMHLSIKKIEPCIEGGYPHSINLAFTDNFLFIVYPAGYWNTGGAAWSTAIIELESGKEVKSWNDKRYPFSNSYTYGNGRFLYSSSSYNETFELKDFNTIYRPEEKEELSANETNRSSNSL